MSEAPAITKNQHLDCANQLTIVELVIVIEYTSQFFTHLILVMDSRHDSVPILIVPYTFVKTNVVVLDGAVLLAYSMLSANFLLNKLHTTEGLLYGKVTVKLVIEIPRTTKYFARTEGSVY